MFLATASTSIKLHEFPSGNIVHNYQPGSKVEGPIRSLSWSKDGIWLLIVPHSGGTEIVGVKDQLKLLKTISDVDEPTCAVFQNTTKRNIALGTKNGLVVIYDVKARNIKKRFPRASSEITHLNFTLKDTHCVAGCKNGDVLVYSNVNNAPPCNLRVPKSSSINCLKISQVKRSLVLGGSNEGIVVVWDLNVSKSKFMVQAHNSPVNSVAFSPVNSNLILTAGQDRQFCFYDIANHDCIASVPVDNSITAVDFSHDGLYFVTAGHNGKAHVYDSRNINEPVLSFQAHSKSVKHLAFQSAQDLVNISACSLSSESITPMSGAIDELSRRNSRSGRTSDFFGVLTPTIDQESKKNACISSAARSLDGGDSFLAALGIDESTGVSRDNGSMFDGPPSHAEVSSARNQIHVSPAPNHTGVSPIANHTGVSPISNQAGVSRVPDHADVSPVPTSSNAGGTGRKKAGEFGGEQYSSTPKLLAVDPQSGESQQARSGKIVSTSTPLDKERIQDTIREVVKDELKLVMNELRADIKYQATHTTFQLRSILYDIQMTLVKEFINLEELLQQVKEQMNPVELRYDSNILLEENEQLRRRNEFLEEQLRALKRDLGGP